MNEHSSIIEKKSPVKKKLLVLLPGKVKHINRLAKKKGAFKKAPFEHMLKNYPKINR
jgi:hypothetical protein